MPMTAAIKADSTFWLAGWRYNSAKDGCWRAARTPILKRGYESHLSAFGERDRLLIELEQGRWLAARRRNISRGCRAIIKRFPNDWSAWW